VVHVSWDDARAFAAWCGGCLASEAEWEHAACGGLDDPRFPWGDAEPADTRIFCNIPYSSRNEDRLHLSGPTVRLPPQAALALAMAFQELATNAVKFGALSNAAGEIRLTWSIDRADGGSVLHLHWQELGGPPVAPPSQRGFGTRLIERSLADDLGGEIRVDFAPTGIVCQARIYLAGTLP